MPVFHEQPCLAEVFQGSIFLWSEVTRPCECVGFGVHSQLFLWFYSLWVSIFLHYSSTSCVQGEPSRFLPRTLYFFRNRPFSFSPSHQTSWGRHPKDRVFSFSPGSSVISPPRHKSCGTDILSLVAFDFSLLTQLTKFDPSFALVGTEWMHLCTWVVQLHCLLLSICQVSFSLLVCTDLTSNCLCSSLSICLFWCNICIRHFNWFQVVHSVMLA